jgi:hypothetical protein
LDRLDIRISKFRRFEAAAAAFDEERVNKRRSYTRAGGAATAREKAKEIGYSAAYSAASRA